MKCFSFNKSSHQDSREQMNARVIVLQTFPNSFSDKCRTYSTKDNDDAQKPRKHPFEFFHSVEKQKKELLEFSLSLRKVERDPVLSKDFFPSTNP